MPRNHEQAKALLAIQFQRSENRYRTAIQFFYADVMHRLRPWIFEEILDSIQYLPPEQRFEAADGMLAHTKVQFRDDDEFPAQARQIRRKALAYIDELPPHEQYAAAIRLYASCTPDPEIEILVLNKACQSLDFLPEENKFRSAKSFYYVAILRPYRRKYPEIQEQALQKALDFIDALPSEQRQAGAEGIYKLAYLQDHETKILRKLLDMVDDLPEAERFHASLAVYIKSRDADLSKAAITKSFECIDSNPTAHQRLETALDFCRHVSDPNLRTNGYQKLDQILGHFTEHERQGILLALIRRPLIILDPNTMQFLQEKLNPEGPEAPRLAA